MQNRHSLGFGSLLLFLSMGSLWATPPPPPDIVAMVTFKQGNAYWQADIKKTPITAQAELTAESKLVLPKGSKLVVMYLATGNEYELNGPGLVQFKNTKPVALNGSAPKTLGSASSAAEKASRIDPKNVHTAGQTLVSTDKQDIQVMPVAASAPAPPPVMAAPVKMADYALEQQQRIAAYEAAKKAAEAEAAASQAKVAASEAWIAEREAAAAAHSAAQGEKVSADVEPREKEPSCSQTINDDKSGQGETMSCTEIKD